MWSRICLPLWSTYIHHRIFSGVCVACSLVFCVVLCRLLFVLLQKEGRTDGRTDGEVCTICLRTFVRVHINNTILSKTKKVSSVKAFKIHWWILTIISYLTTKKTLSTLCLKHQDVFDKDGFKIFLEKDHISDSCEILTSCNVTL